MLMVRALDLGGTERQVTEIAKNLDSARFSPHVGCFVEDGIRADELRTRNIPILKMRMRSFVSRDSIDVLLEMRRYICTHRIRLVHTFDFPMNIFGVPVARLLRVPVVLSSQRSYRQLIPPKYIPALRVSDRLANGIVVNCEAIRRHLRESFSVPDSKISTCYNALDSSLFQPGPRKRPAFLQDAELVVGVVCVLRAIKSVKTLVAAFAQSALSRPSVRLVIVGSGPEKEALERQAIELGISGQTSFVPATHEVAAWMKAMDIFVLPSTSEALSNSLMEAMASGCCAIASRVGGNPELIMDGHTGLLFEAGDVESLAKQLERAIDDESLRLRLAKAGAEKITREFSRERSIAAVQEVYLKHLQLV